MPQKPYLVFLMLSLAACGDDPCPTGQVRVGVACVDDMPDASEADADTEADAPTRPNCTGMTDGEVCGEGLVCIDELCLDTRCGDGYADEAAGEDCDDGNEISGDGCEPATCEFSCTAETEESCSDGDPCNGPEFCGEESHRCERGEPAEETACEREDASVGICSGGLCAPLGCGNGTREGDEVCDDGNEDQDDGCKTDCTYTCVEDIDCSDADACTGVETCEVATHTCVDAPDLECNDEDECTADTCEPATGCVFSLIDGDDDGYAAPATCTTPGLNGGDCDDGDDGLHPGVLEICDDIDNDCDEQTDEDIVVQCLADGDRDGYGTEPSFTRACMCTGATVPPRPDNNVDCDDEDANVHEGQRAYFNTPHCIGGACGENLPFDYDCDGVEEQRYATIATTCEEGAFDQCRGSGWKNVLQACGVNGAYLRCERRLGECRFVEGREIQECR